MHLFGWRRGIPAVLLALLPSLAQAGLVPRLVRDVDAGSSPAGSSPRQIIGVNHGVAFTAFGDRELWFYDDREDSFYRALQREEIRHLSDSIYAAREASGDWTFWYAWGWPYYSVLPVTGDRVRRLGARYGGPDGGLVAFEADQGRGRGLWTFCDFPASHLCEAARPLPLDDGSLLRDWTDWSGGAYFIARHRTQGTALWKLDAGGAHPVVAPSPGKNLPLRLAGALRGQLLLAISGGEPELWWSDRRGHLRPFTEIVPGRGGATIVEAKVIERRAFLVVDDGLHGQQLWTSDGTAAGTRPLTRFTSDASRRVTLPAVRFGESWYFTADDGIHGRELWKTDGTPQGTRLVADLCPGPCNSDPRDLRAQYSVVSGVTFTATPPEGPRALFRSDGTPQETVQLTPPGVAATSGLQLGYLFSAADPTFGDELWTTEGTPETTRIKDALGLLAGGFNLHLLGAAGDRLLFRPSTQDAGLGFRLWTSDGTAAGTFALPGPHSPRMGATDPTPAAQLGRRLLFKGQIRHAPPSLSALWATDGTEAGFERLTPPGVTVESSPHRVGLQVLFFAREEEHGTELWTSGGTAATTHRLTDLAAGSASAGVDLDTVTLLRGQLAFRRADDAFHLWISDGTVEGTRRLVDADPLLAPIDRRGRYGWPVAAELPGRLLFLGAREDSGPATLWVTDGTAEGTAPLEFADAGGDSWELFPAATRVFFTVTVTTPEGAESTHLWVTDGTSAGTARVPVPPPLAYFSRMTPVAFGDRLIVSDELGRFQVTDGSTGGTFALLDPEGREISDRYNSQAIVFKNRLVFSGGLGTCYLWNGTGATVERLENLACRAFAIVGDRLFFSGFQPPAGEALWVMEER